MKKQLGRITVNPHVCMGQPTIRGMRITVAFVLKLLASGMSNNEISMPIRSLNWKTCNKPLNMQHGWLVNTINRSK